MKDVPLGAGFEFRHKTSRARGGGCGGKKRKEENKGARIREAVHIPEEIWREVTSYEKSC